MKKFEKEWQKRFERFAKYEEEHLISGWSENGLRQRLSVFNILLNKQKIQCPSRILDIGSGAGTYVRFLSNLGHRVVGLDYSQQSLQRALETSSNPNSDYIAGDAYNLPFCDDSFDIVVTVGVLQTLSSPEGVLDEMIRVLRPGGIIIIDFLNACEVIALIKSAVDILRGREPRVRTYFMKDVKLWLDKRAIKFVESVGVYLPPRKYSWIGKTLNYKGVLRLIENIPGLSFLTAHAFMLAGKKRQETLHNDF